MIKSKLLRIKKWIDANEAADRLSLSLEDKVSALDLLELALDKEITLSVKFPRTKHFVIREVKVASMPYIKRLEETFDFYLMGKFKKAIGHPERGSSEYNSLFEAYLVDECLKHNFSLAPSNKCGLSGEFPSVYNVEYEYFDYSQNLQYMDDVIFELPMIGAEFIDIASLIETNKKREPSELMNIDGVFLRSSNGKLYNLMNRFDEGYVSVFNGEKDVEKNVCYLDNRNYYPAEGLPVGCEIGISPANLFDFERRLSDDGDEVDEVISQKALVVLGAVLQEVTERPVKWSQGRLALSIDSRNIRGMKERTINGIFSLANKALKSNG